MTAKKWCGDSAYDDLWDRFMSESTPANPATLGSIYAAAQAQGWPYQVAQAAKTPTSQKLVISASLLEIIPLNQVIPVPLEWLWPGFLPHGKISIIAGNPGLGKSQVTLDIAARISTGSVWPTGEANIQGKVLLVCCEDDPADTIVPRLVAAGANLSNIALIRSVRVQDSGKQKQRALSLQDDLEKIRAHLKNCPETRLIIIDPVSAYMGKTDSHKNAEVRAVLDPLASLAQEHRVSILLVTHLNKGKTSVSDWRCWL